MQLEAERRAKIFEEARARNLEEQSRLRQLQLLTQFKLNNIENYTNHVATISPGAGDLNIVTEKTLHEKYSPMSTKKGSLSLVQIECDLPPAVMRTIVTVENQEEEYKTATENKKQTALKQQASAYPQADIQDRRSMKPNRV